MALAKFIGVPPSFVSKMCSGEKSIPAEHCKTIERFSAGQVSCQEMRPDDWDKYWPELAPSPNQTALAAVEAVVQGVA